jgi:hypothetical protein
MCCRAEERSNGSEVMTESNAPADWKSFDDFADGIATNRLPITDKLVGRSLSVALENGQHYELSFDGMKSIRWTHAGASGLEVGEVIEVDDDLFFVDFTYSSRPAEDHVFIINLKSGRVLSVAEVVRPVEAAKGEPRVAQSYVAGTLDRAEEISGPAPAPTRDLIGLTAHYEYSPNHVYEHIYLSSQRYAWQNLVGVQRGQGDVDLATTYKFDEDIYVFGFREFIIPVASLFLYNWKTMRSTGKFLGESRSGKIENMPAGAFIRKMSSVTYPAASEPV